MCNKCIEEASAASETELPKEQRSLEIRQESSEEPEPHRFTDHQSQKQLGQPEYWFWSSDEITGTMYGSGMNGKRFLFLRGWLCLWTC